MNAGIGNKVHLVLNMAAMMVATESSRSRVHFMTSDQNEVARLRMSEIDQGVDLSVENTSIYDFLVA